MYEGFVVTYCVNSLKKSYEEKRFFNNLNEARKFYIKMSIASNVVGIVLSKIKFEPLEIVTIKNSSGDILGDFEE